MSLVARTLVLRYLFRDNDGAEAESILNLAAGTPITSALSFLLTFAGVSSNLSTAALVAASLLVRWQEAAGPGAGEDADTDRRGVLVFEVADGQAAAVHVPSLADELLMTTGPYAGIAIDTSNPAAAALIGALRDGLAGVQPCDVFGLDLGDLAAAYRQQAGY